MVKNWAGIKESNQGLEFRARFTASLLPLLAFGMNPNRSNTTAAQNQHLK